MAILKQSTTYRRSFLMVGSADHVTGSTASSTDVTVVLYKGGSTSSSTAAGAISPQGSGWFNIYLTSADVNTVGDLVFHCTATSADPTDFCDQVVTQTFADLSINASGEAQIASNIKQNTALNGFTFVMTDNVNHYPATGLSVSAERSLGGAGFSPCANSVSEVSDGVYTINLAAADVNSATSMLHFSASGADDLNIMLVTQP